MKIYSIQHFEEMQMMNRYFERNLKYNDLYLTAFETSKIINNIIEKEEDNDVGIEKILNLLTIIEKSQYVGDTHWLDYKIHVMATLRVNA